MHILFTLLSLIASAYAYQVITPGGASGWTTAGPNVVTWQRVDTDPRNFTILLVNQNAAIMPLGSQVLAALVDGTLDTFTVSPPSTGYPTGTGFRVNLVVDSEHLDSILAQSQQFSIVQPNTTASVTRTIATPTTPVQTTDTGASDSNPTSSLTNTTAPSNAAHHISTAGSAGLIIAILAAIVL